MKLINIYKKLLLILLLILPANIFASTPADNVTSITHDMVMLIMQIGIIIIAAKLSSRLFEKIKLPSVLGEVLTGVIIGPYLLGSIPLPGFHDGIFPLNTLYHFPVSPELYGIATIASIILLFMAGLETDFKLFLRLSGPGIIIGIGGVIFSFSFATLITAYYFQLNYFDPTVLLMGVISTATSVGITIRILTQHKKMSSPEGVIIVTSAIIDDIIGIILLAVVLGMATVSKLKGMVMDWSNIGLIAFKEIAIWTGFLIIGLILAHRISSILKYFKSIDIAAVLALGMALIISAVFEKLGLAMIIGAYMMGLILSKTDLKYVILGKLNIIQAFFIPVFFTVMGMLVNIKQILSPDILLFGLIFSIIAFLSKFLGCGIPALFLNFNRLGASRIGLGMMPRAEVALIIASVGLTTGILSQNLFGVVIMMSISSILISPVILDRLFIKDSKGVKKDFKTAEKITLGYNFPSEDLTSLIITNIVQFLEDEGFLIYQLQMQTKLFQIRKNNIEITLYCYPKAVTFEFDKKDLSFVRNIVYETLLKQTDIIRKLKHITRPKDLAKNIFEGESRKMIDLKKIIDPKCIIIELKSETKNDILEELINVLYDNKKIIDKEKALDAVIKREATMSTGMQYGIAIPHGKTDGVNDIVVAIGIKKQGIEFQSIDGQLSRLFIMMLSPESVSGPHIQLLANIGTLLNSEEIRDKILKANTADEIYNIFIKN